MKRFILIALAFVLVGAGLIVGPAALQAYRVANLEHLADDSECSLDVLHIGGPWGQTEIAIEVADTKRKRARGFMNREHIPQGTGMLFVYDEPTEAMFWMRNTLVPLDILFFDQRGDLRHVHFAAQPHDLTPIPGGPDVKLALEVPAGDVNRLGIGARSSIRHPLVETEHARWAC